MSKRVVRVGHINVEPISFTNNTITFKAPEANVENTAPISVSLNGQQFTQQPHVHDFSREVVYDYYDVPYTSFYMPRRGPTNGGTTISAEGYGFKLNRPNLKDRLWVRFTDASSGSALAPADEIKKESFDFDSFEWNAPAVSSAGNAFMQVSLNNQDWHDARDPNGDGFTYYQSPHVTSISPSFGHVKAKEDVNIDVSGSGFQCIDTACEELKCRFGNHEGQYIYVTAKFTSSDLISCPVPRYTKPDVVNVEVTINDESYTNDNKTYGFFDPFVLDAEPRLIATDGSTIVDVIGIGFVDSGESKALFNNRSFPIVCGEGKGQCSKPATFVDKKTLRTATFPQSTVKYSGSGESVAWDPMYIDATVIGDEFTENQVDVYYYEEPQVLAPNIQESPANLQSQLLIALDFKGNDMNRISQYSKPKCRFTAGSKVQVVDGVLITYPLSGSQDPSDLNTIHCKSPKWSHSSQDAEQAKLDVSINGQNYFGSLDFTFTRELILHRDVPMAGPQRKETNVKLVGQGFKMPKRSTDVKWGVETTEVIQASNVSDYTYYLDGFLTMVPGSEELRAYKDEAAGFSRVDTTMNEGISYDITTKISKLTDNEAQLEGPGYVEVGIDEVLAKKPEFKADNAFEKNDTGIVTYNYNPSAVEFYTYRQPNVMRIHPTQGLTKGGTDIEIIGTWFKYMPEYGIVPHCRFGDMVVRAHFDSTVRLVCKSPSTIDPAVKLPFSVSLNGVDWDTGANEFTYSYYEEPIMSNIYPDMGSVQGGEEIYIKGEKFSNITDGENFKCRFKPINIPVPAKTVRARFINSTHIMCPSPGGWSEADKMHLQVTWNGVDYDSNNFIFTFFSIHRAFPRSGPSNGKGGEVTIEGEGFRDDVYPKCLMNKTIYEPISVTATAIKCPIPQP